MGSLMSYSDGALSMMPALPPRQASVNIHRKKRSRTIAMNFQSSITFSRFIRRRKRKKRERERERREIRRDRRRKRRRRLEKYVRGTDPAAGGAIR